MKYLLRRKGLGNTSCREISNYSNGLIKVVRNDAPFPDDCTEIIRWGCTSNVPNGVTVINKAHNIHLVADKKHFRMLTAEACLAPMSWATEEAYADWAFRYWESMGPGDDDLLGNHEKTHQLIVRRDTHHQGKFLHKCESWRDLEVACAAYDRYYISEYIPKVAEYRVFVVSGRVVWVAKKTPADANAVAWNVAQGGRFDNVRWGDWPIEMIKTSLAAFELSGLDFGGVDVMVDEDGRSYVLEINSAPSQTSPYRQSCTAAAFSYETWILPAVAGDAATWKDFIHPALVKEKEQ